MSSSSSSAVECTVTVDRDSVCAGDSSDPHERSYTVDRDTMLLQLLAMIRQSGFLASISGDKATWLIDVVDETPRCIGVLAQQWDTPRLIIPDTAIGPMTAAGQLRLFFRYWLQSDPERVFASLQSGTALPPPYQTNA